MDFVAVWKATSIVVTGFFGVLALLTEFKDKKTDKITKWGRLSLTGIVVSTGLGMAAQLKEQTDQERSRQKLAGETLKLTQNTDRAVTDIQRMLTTIDEPVLAIKLEIPCTDGTYGKYCKLPEMAQILGNVIVEKQRPKARVNLGFCLMKDAAVADQSPDNISFNCDLSFTASFSDSLDHGWFWLAHKGENVITKIWGAKASISTSSGKIVSLRDIPGATVEVYGFEEKSWKPTGLRIRTRNAQQTDFDAEFHPIGDTTGYRAVPPPNRS